MDAAGSTAQPEAVAAIRFADAICDHYFEVVRRLEKSGRRMALVGGDQMADPDVGLLCGEAEQTLSSLRDSLAAARRLSARREPAAPLPKAEDEFDRLQEDVRDRIGLREALEARRALAGLKSDWPGVDWTAGKEEAAVDLFAAKKRTALIVAGVALVAIAVLAVFYPVAAAGVAGLVVMGWVWWIAIIGPRMRRLGM
jgi:hypothetical protein